MSNLSNIYENVCHQKLRNFWVVKPLLSHTGFFAISYPESSGSLDSSLVARRDSGEMEFFPQKSGVPVVVRMLSFIKTEVNVSREVGMLDESLDGNQKS